MIRATQSRFSPSPELLKRCQSALQEVMRAKDSAFPLLTERDELWTISQKVGSELRERFDHLVIVGIGGSSLGAQVVSSRSLQSRLRFIENVDARAIDRALAGLDWKRTGYLLVSKTGGTIETLSATEALRQMYAEKGLNFLSHSHVLTESKDNILGSWAVRHHVGLTLIPSDVGGRYSVLSPVGMIPAVFDGLKAENFRVGAREVLANQELVAQMMAQTLMSFEREEWITFFWIYEPTGRVLGSWIQQLWAESLGKKVDRKGNPAPRASTPVVGLGTVDQHSVLQQVMEGAKDKFVVFLRSEEAESGGPVLKASEFSDCQMLIARPMGHLFRAEAIATEEALHQNGVSTLALTTEVLDEKGLGSFFMFMQLTVAGLGVLLQINPFDQPGVELGKRLAKDLLRKP